MSTPALTEDQVIESLVSSTKTAASIHKNSRNLVNTQKFDWSKIIQTIAGDEPPPGQQVINFFSTDRPYQQDPEARAFVEQYLSNAKRLNIDAEVLKYACEQMRLEGFILEMGVCTGRTINFLAALNPRKLIYGFDSFCGLPEPWHGRTDFALPKGVFGFKDPSQRPPVLHNVRLIDGLFQDSLPRFKQEILGEQPISFLHIDCDIYSSTKTIFSELGNNLVDGTIILFDDLYNYPGFKGHEFKAFQEFLDDQNKVADYLAFNVNCEQVAVRILNKT